MNNLTPFDLFAENFTTATPNREPGNSFDKDKIIYKGQKVKVFRNLNTSTVLNRFDRNDVIHGNRVDDVIWSIRDFKSNLSVHYAYNLWLKDVSFLVSEAGRNKVLRSGQKDIHSFIVGNLMTWKPFKFDVDLRQIEVTDDIDVEDNRTWSLFAKEEPGKGLMRQRLSGWVAVYYNPYQVDRYVIANTPLYQEKGLAGREVLSAKECIMAQQRFGDKVIPICYVLDAVLGDVTITDWSNKGATPRGKKAGTVFTPKYKNKKTTQDKIDAVNHYYTAEEPYVAPKLVSQEVADRYHGGVRVEDNGDNYYGDDDWNENDTLGK